jgi:hypothetical protein
MTPRLWTGTPDNASAASAPAVAQCTKPSYCYWSDQIRIADSVRLAAGTTKRDGWAQIIRSGVAHPCRGIGGLWVHTASSLRQDI